MKCLKIISIIIFLLLKANVHAQIPNIIINEFLALNSNIIYDKDLFQYSDWIEIYNDDLSEINLNGYFITDNLNDPTKWMISDDIIIQAKGYGIL